MGLTIEMVMVDAADAKSLAAFWKAALGATEIFTDDTYVILKQPDGLPNLGFQNVPDGRVGKNRLHLDLHAEPGRRRAEADRLVALGATIVEERSLGENTRWIVMADPEGNEFCVADHG